jgi:hypothetical protein
MAGKFSNTNPPGQGYTEAATRSRGITDKSGRGVPDERRTFSEERENLFPGNVDDDTLTGRKAGYGADPTNVPPGSASEAASASADTGTADDEASSGRVQGG